MGDLSSLAASLASVGMIHPIVVNGEFELVAGARRLAAAKLLNWTAAPVIVCYSYDETETALKAEMDENLCRKDFTPEEAVVNGEKIEAMLKPMAEARVKSGKKMEASDPGGNSPRVGRAPRVADVAAAAAGMDRRTYEGAKKVVAAAKDNPALRPVVEKMNETGNVTAAVREVAEIMEAETPGEPEELTPLSKAIAGLEKLKTLTRQLRNAAKEVFVFNDDKCPTTPYLTKFNWMTVIGMLNDYLTALEAGTPTGGTPENPDTKRSDKMAAALGRKS
jgi:ParB-like chromosome segregation protein Spo0J